MQDGRDGADETVNWRAHLGEGGRQVASGTGEGWQQSEKVVQCAGRAQVGNTEWKEDSTPEWSAPDRYPPACTEMDMGRSTKEIGRYVRHASQQPWLFFRVFQGSFLVNETTMFDRSGLYLGWSWEERKREKD
jgi:hypothetical protein